MPFDMANKGFHQMPRHIQIIGHVYNIIIWIIPVIISIAVYIKIIRRGKNLAISSTSLDKNRSQHINTISAGIIIQRQRLNPVAQEPQNVVGPRLNSINETSSTSNTNAIEVANVEVLQIQDSEQNTYPSIPQSFSPQPRFSSHKLEASARAMKTNLLMLLLFCLNYSLLIIPSVNWTKFMAFIFATILKFLIPTVTTISNFGPVRELMMAYLHNIIQP
jgi:hypothetical protein